MPWTPNLETVRRILRSGVGPTRVRQCRGAVTGGRGSAACRGGHALAAMRACTPVHGPLLHMRLCTVTPPAGSGPMSAWSASCRISHSPRPRAAVAGGWQVAGDGVDDLPGHVVLSVGRGGMGVGGHEESRPRGGSRLTRWVTEAASWARVRCSGAAASNVRVSPLVPPSTGPGVADMAAGRHRGQQLTGQHRARGWADHGTYQSPGSHRRT
jgi:hypothetical protein